MRGERAGWVTLSTQCPCHRFDPLSSLRRRGPVRTHRWKRLPQRVARGRRRRCRGEWLGGANAGSGGGAAAAGVRLGGSGSTVGSVCVVGTNVRVLCRPVKRFFGQMFGLTESGSRGVEESGSRGVGKKESNSREVRCVLPRQAELVETSRPLQQRTTRSFDFAQDDGSLTPLLLLDFSTSRLPDSPTSRLPDS
jgi:hypothetical protein